MMNKIKKINNMWWSISILVLIIIGLLSYILANNISTNKLSILKFLEFSGTLLSVVLSVFAISYSYTSMTESNSQWGKVTQATKLIEKSTNHIFDNNKALLDIVIELSNTVHHMEGIIGSNYQINKQSEDLKKYESNKILATQQNGP